MLVAALAVTLVGFILLVVALITSSVAFAWACIVVCLIGFGLLLADVFGVRKRGKTQPESHSDLALADEAAPADAEEAQAAVAEPQPAVAEPQAVEPSGHAFEAHVPEQDSESAIWGPGASEQTADSFGHAEDSLGRQSGKETQ